MKIPYFFPFLLLSINIFSQINPEISVADIKRHISFLASDSLQGRKPGTIYDSISANYIYKQFNNAGLKFFNNNPYQSFEIINSAHYSNNNNIKFKETNKELNNGFEPHWNSLNGNYKAKVSFVGYGINSSEYKRNDYRDIDIKGNWAMILMNSPENQNEELKISDFASLSKKILTAKDNGAIGLIIIKNNKLPNINKYHYGISFGMPVIFISEKIANTILKNNVKKLKSKLINNNLYSFNTDVELEANIEIIIDKQKTQNIIGYIEGKSEKLKNEYIVLGAHYDHLGIGGKEVNSRKPDTIAVHNGADDNASGVAGIIELAEKISKNKSEFDRSIIFIAFSAEEMGLLGSKYFIENPPIDLKKIIYMANFDMIGRMTENPVQLLSAASALEIDSLIEIAGKNYDLNYKIGKGASSGSDHAPFYYENIPVVFFFTGIHSDYHTPYDDIEKINFEGAEKILFFAYDLIKLISNKKNALTFNKINTMQSSERVTLKVTFGIMPDFTANDIKGVLVGGVNKDGPADKAGIIKGDIISSINNKSLENIYDYMSRLGELKKGDKIDVEIVRNNEIKKIKVEF